MLKVAYEEVNLQDLNFNSKMNKIITVQIPEFDLNLGPHKIGMGFDVPGIGTLRFDFTDEPQG